MHIYTHTQELLGEYMTRGNLKIEAIFDVSWGGVRYENTVPIGRLHMGNSNSYCSCPCAVSMCVAHVQSPLLLSLLRRVMGWRQTQTPKHQLAFECTTQNDYRADC